LFNGGLAEYSFIKKQKALLPGELFYYPVIIQERIVDE